MVVKHVVSRNTFWNRPTGPKQTREEPVVHSAFFPERRDLRSGGTLTPSRHLLSAKAAYILLPAGLGTWGWC